MPGDSKAAAQKQKRAQLEQKKSDLEKVTKQHRGCHVHTMNVRMTCYSVVRDVSAAIWHICMNVSIYQLFLEERNREPWKRDRHSECVRSRQSMPLMCQSHSESQSDDHSLKSDDHPLGAHVSGYSILSLADVTLWHTSALENAELYWYTPDIRRFHSQINLYPQLKLTCHKFSQVLCVRHVFSYEG